MRRGELLRAAEAVALRDELAHERRVALVAEAPRQGWAWAGAGVRRGGRAKGWAREGAGLRVERGLGRRSERRVGAAEGDLLTMSPICGNSSRAKSTGAVARPWSMSDSAGLPSEAALPTKSRWSSTSCRSKHGQGAQAAHALDYAATLTVCAYLVGDAYLLTY